MNNTNTDTNINTNLSQSVQTMSILAPLTSLSRVFLILTMLSSRQDFSTGRSKSWTG